jgi:hypothetical protein
MNKSSVDELIASVKSSIKNDLLRRGGNALESIAELSPERRMAVGYSRHDGEFWLELRIQRRNGPAETLARKFLAKAAGESQLRRVGTVEVPTRKQVDSNPDDAVLARQRRPLTIGVSVSHINGPAGTLGAFVAGEDGDAILSASHVLALPGEAGRNALICHPGGSDLDQVTDDHHIARLKNWTTLRSPGTNLFDAAVAVLEEGIEHTGSVIPSGIGAPDEGEQIVAPGPIDELDANTLLAKIGRTTGYTEGVFSAIIESIAVKAEINKGMIDLHFSKVIEIEWKSEKKPFTRPGDSGSLIYSRDNRQAVGLHFAGGITEDIDKKTKREVSYACDLTPILERWGLTLI